MPTLARASPDRELERLIRLYLKAENNIINEIGRLRSRGLVDYHAVAALERVQAILRQLEADDWEYVPRLVEAQFYVRRPDARAVPGETVEKHRAGYLNAKTLTSTQTDIVQRLTMNLMGQLTDAHSTVLAGLQSALLGRTEPDIYRRVGLEQVAAQQAAGRGINQSVPAFVDALRREGVTAFTRNRIYTRSAPTAPPVPCALPTRAGCTAAAEKTRTSRRFQTPSARWTPLGRMIFPTAG